MVLGRLGAVLEASWARVGASWARLGRVLERLGRVLARLGRVLARLGAADQNSGKRRADRTSEAPNASHKRFVFLEVLVARI